MHLAGCWSHNTLLDKECAQTILSLSCSQNLVQSIVLFAAVELKKHILETALYMQSWPHQRPSCRHPWPDARQSGYDRPEGKSPPAPRPPCKAQVQASKSIAHLTEFIKTPLPPQTIIKLRLPLDCEQAAQTHHIGIYQFLILKFYPHLTFLQFGLHVQTAVVNR